MLSIIQKKKPMKKISKYFAMAALSCLMMSCIKKPAACVVVSDEAPKKDDYITIDGSCSKNAKWYVYEIDGQSRGGDFSGDLDYSFSTAGKHVIRLTVYTKWNGSFNSRTGCSGCSGAGKSNSTTKEITVSN